MLPGEARAHAAERGFVLLLPTGHYLAGGAAVVALTFLGLAFATPERVAATARHRLFVSPLPRGRFALLSWLSFALLLPLVLAGLFGSRDPLENPLPLTVWTMFWIGMPLLSGLFGDLWSALEPWRGPCRFARRLGMRPWLSLPRGLGRLPALALLFGFAWFELIDPAPDDPRRLALAAAAYWAGTFAAMLLFGRLAWRRQGEFFSVLFSMLARLAILDIRREPGGRRRLALCLPGARLAQSAALSPFGMLFLLLALAAVSFDGLSKTFLYLGLIGVNPLEHPGRSALVAVNTAGLLLAFAGLSLLYLGAVALGRRLAGVRGENYWVQAGTLVWSLAPIALAYQFAHYLASFLVNAQYWLVVLSDPFERGWDLFGTVSRPVRASIAAGSDAAWLIWNVQAAAIVVAHLLGLALAHGLCARLRLRPGQAFRFLLPLSLCMILYTVFGLWLLSTPTGA